MSKEIISNRDYRKHSGISRSELQLLRKSPYHFQYAQNNPDDDSESLKFGRACHKYILEPDDFENEFAVMPKLDRRTIAGREMYDEFVEKNAKKEIITETDYDIICEMAKAMDAVPLAKELLKGEHEVSYFWTDPDTGIECKCRPDCLSTYEGFGKKMLVDYKTTSSCEDGAFEKSCKKYGYQLQSGMYREGVFQNTFDDVGFAFVAQEKSAPYAVRIYVCSEEFINQGYDEFRSLIGTYKYCTETEDWFGYEGQDKCVTQLLGEGE